MTLPRRTEIELAKIKIRLLKEPWPRAEIIAVNQQDGKSNDLKVQVKFDISHPHAPNQNSEIMISCNEIYQFYEEDGVVLSRRLREPKVGMVGILRNTQDPRDGITLHWQFVAKAT